MNTISIHDFTMKLYSLLLFSLLQSSSNANHYSMKRGYGSPSITKQACEKHSCTVDTDVSNKPFFLGEYIFKVSPLTVEECFSNGAMENFRQSLPVVLKNCNLAKPTEKWSMNYLKNNMLSDNMTAYVSNTRRFLYYNEKVPQQAGYKWKKPHEIKLMKFDEFLEMSEELNKAGNESRAYFQSHLDKADLSSAMQDDMFLFNYPWLRNLTQELGWGGQDLNILFVGMKDVVTPAHYDIVEGLFLQISGWKKAILFHPDQYKNLYPFPVHHPHDRQTQVNFDEPDLEKFPNFPQAEGMETILGPGDVLYIPNYWWHYFESERNNYTMSINFWFEPNPPFQPLDTIFDEEEIDEQTNTTSKKTIAKEQDGDKETADSSEEKDKANEADQSEEIDAGLLLGTDVVSSSRRMFVRRRIEEFIALSLQNSSEVGPMLKEMVTSRFDNLEL